MVVSIVSGLIILVLTSLQLYSFMRTKTVTTLKVESQMGNVIDSELDISFLEMDCASGMCVGCLSVLCWLRFCLPLPFWVDGGLVLCWSLISGCAFLPWFWVASFSLFPVSVYVCVVDA